MEEKTREKQEWDFKWGHYHKKNSDRWIYEILKKIKYNTIENETDLEKEDTLIIVDSSVEEKIELYTKLSMICSKIFLFHLGDEAGIRDLSEVYKNCVFVWRTFCSSGYFNNDKV